jgi:beta-lactamase class D
MTPHDSIRWNHSNGGAIYGNAGRLRNNPIVLLILVLCLVGCSQPAQTPVASSTPGIPSTPDATPTPMSVEKADLASEYQGFTGAFVLYDQNKNQIIRYNPQRCAERLLPFSTFKILNALIGLETGVIPDETYVIHWDGTQYPITSWNQDHTMKTAIQNSVVWYFQELARRVGKEKMQHYVSAVGYGNQDISGQIDNFWLQGPLKISADEQVNFLRRLYHNDLPFSQRSMQIVRGLILQDKTDAYQLSGKTGSGQMDSNHVAWFVGYVETKEDVFFFASNIASENQDASPARAREIALKVLKDVGVLP